MTLEEQIEKAYGINLQSVRLFITKGGWIKSEDVNPYNLNYRKDEVVFKTIEGKLMWRLLELEGIEQS